MTIAVIGTGGIGGTLGRAFARAGNRTVFGSRHPDSASNRSIAGDSGATVTTIDTAIEQAATVLLAIPGGAVDDLLRTHGEAMEGRLIVDSTNSMSGPVAHHADTVAELAPGARYARAFNTLGVENFADPRFDGEVADLFFSSPTGDRETVEELGRAVGLRPVYVGEGAEDVVDGVLRLWFALAVGQGHGRHLGFRTLIRNGTE